MDSEKRRSPLVAAKFALGINPEVKRGPRSGRTYPLRRELPPRTFAEVQFAVGTTAIGSAGGMVIPVDCLEESRISTSFTRTSGRTTGSRAAKTAYEGPAFE